MIKFIHSGEIAKTNKKHKGTILGNFSKLMDSGNYINGEYVIQFEKEFANYCKNFYCVSVNSGTDALILSLKNAGVQAGDEVLMPSVSFFATACAALNLNAKIKFVDIDLNTYNIDYDALVENITEKTKAILPVHWAGRPLDPKRLGQISKKTAAPIIEDAAQAAGAYAQEGPVGSSNNSVAFSFFPTKNLSCIGDGGAIVTASKKKYERLKLLRNFGREGREKFSLVGQNSRLDEVQAMILLEKLKGLDEENNKRRRLAIFYDKYLHPDILRPNPESVPGHAYHFYIVLLPSNRNTIQQELFKKGVETTTHYATPIHQHLISMGFNEFKHLELENTKKYSECCLSLPMYSSLKEEEMAFIAKNINELI